jgi:hypothetical protein
MANAQLTEGDHPATPQNKWHKEIGPPSFTTSTITIPNRNEHVCNPGRLPLVNWMPARSKVVFILEIVAGRLELTRPRSVSPPF